MAANVWVSSGDQPLGYDPVGALPLEPPRGGSNWRILELPPDAIYAAELARNPIQGLDSDGLHRTSTLDYVLILEGEIVLELDSSDVLLRAGDVVVQRATMHAWRNRTNRPVRMAVVMISMESTL